MTLERKDTFDHCVVFLFLIAVSCLRVMFNLKLPFDYLVVVGAGLDTIFLLSPSQLFVTLAWNVVLAGKAQGQLENLNCAEGNRLFLLFKHLSTYLDS